MSIAIIVHGGAGAWKLREERLPEAVSACADAAARGHSILQGGGSALDAVEAAVRDLEDCPYLDAGRGSYLNANGQVEMDAIIMEGRSLDMGAVGAIQRVRHPISLARRVMVDCEHNFLVAHGAESFAEEIGFPRCELSDLLVEEEKKRLQRLRGEEGNDPSTVLSEEALGTVGAVALDEKGDLAAATSTGGTRRKKAGRIGDSPQVGSGAYADNWTAAASATGYGEALMKIVISRRVCEFVGAGLSAQAACESAIQLLGERVQGKGGIIAVDALGRIGLDYNTVAMPHAYAVDDSGIESGH